MAKNYTAPELEKIIEDIGKRLNRVESRNPITVGSSLFGGALSAGLNGGIAVNAITINGPGGQTVLTLPKLGDLVPSGFTADPNWEAGLLVGATGSSVVDLDWNPATGPGSDQITAWQVRLQIVGDPFDSDYTFSDHPQRIRNLKPGADYVAYLSPIDQFGNITNAQGASAAFTAAFNTSAPAWQSINANLQVNAAYTTLTVTWTDDADDPDVGAGNGSYDVQIATDSLFTQNIQNLRVSGTVCTFTGLTTGTTYYVRVRALNSSGYAGSDGVQNQWIVFGGATPQGSSPGGITSSLATDITAGAVRNTQQTYLVSAGIHNPSTPTANFSNGSDGNLVLNANGASGTPLNRVTDLAAFDGTAINYNAPNTGGQPRTTGPYYSALQPGKYKAVFYLKSTSAGIPSTQPILSVIVQGVSGNVLESGQAVVVTADQLGNSAVGAGVGACDGGYHAVAIPLTVVRDWTSGDFGLELIANAAYGTMNWSLSYISIVPFTALVSNEITSNYIAANAIVAGKIAASAVTAESLSIKATTPYRNLNYDFEDVSSLYSSLPSHWVANYDFSGGTGNGPANIYLQTQFKYSGSQAIAIAATMIDATHFTGGAIASDAFTVSPGEVLTVDGWLRQNRSDLTGGVYVRVYFGPTANFLVNDPGMTYVDLPGLSGAGVNVLPQNTWVSVAAAAASSGGTNILTAEDASFENPGVGTWFSVGNPATLAHSTAQAYIGSSSMAITANTTSQVVVRTDIYPFTAGIVGRASLFIRAGTTGRVHSCRIEYTDGNGNTIGYFQNFVTDTSAGWLPVTASGVAPAGTTGARVVVFGGGVVVNGEVHYIDNVSLAAAVVTSNQVTVPQNAWYARVTAYMWQPTGLANGNVSTLYVDRLVISGAVLGTQIANGTISTPNIVVGGVNADRITAGTITGTQVRANSLVADSVLVNNSLTAKNILVTGSIEAAQIKGGEISADKLAASMVLVSGQVFSASYSQGNTGWTIQQNGYAEFNNCAIRGVLYAATFGGSYFDFKAVDNTNVALRISAGAGYSYLQLGQGMVNVGAYLSWEPTLSQMQYIGYYNIGDSATWKFMNGFVEADGYRTIGGYALSHWINNGTQGYFIGNDSPGNGAPVYDSNWGLQIEQRGGTYNVFIQGVMDSDQRHTGIRNQYDGSQQFYCDFNGGSRSISRTGVIVPSDEHLKHDLRELELDKAATAGSVINALKPMRYTLKHDRKFHKKPREHLGFGAAAVKAILPEAVHENVFTHEDDADQGYLGISYDTFIPVLVKHNQEQQIELDELRARVKKLEKALAG